MAAVAWRNVFVGAETGLLKGVNVEKKQWDNLNELQTSSRQKEITALCWTNEEQSQICLGRRDHAVMTYDTDSGHTEDMLEISGGSGPIKGLALWEESLVTCTESGHLQVWRDEQEQVTMDAGSNLYFMRQNPSEGHLVATGGKENNLKLWNLNEPEEPAFKAKNVCNDWLNLRVPIWVTDAAFIPLSQKVVTSTGLHQVRVYDPSAQRRPVLDMAFDEYPITCMSLREGGHQVVVGNTQGTMALLDIRKGAEVQRYKGFAGAIRCVQCHPTLPLVASCGLDRFLRIHDLNSKQLLSKIYLKSRLNCLLMRTEWDSKQTDSQQETPSVISVMNQSEDSGHESQDDDMWQQMEVVKTKKLKRKPKYEEEERRDSRK